jgi:hydrogenase-4 component F
MTESPFLLWLLLIPFILSMLIFASRWFGGMTRGVVTCLHLISVSLILGLSLLNIGLVLNSGEIFGLGELLHVDALAAIFLLIIGIVGFLVGLYSIGYTQHELQTGNFDNGRLCNYYGLFSLFLCTMLLVVTANNIIIMWAAVEATTLGSVFLIGINGTRPSLEAAWKYIIICTVGVAFGLYGTILVYSNAFDVQLSSNAVLWTEIIKYPHTFDPALIKMAFVFVLVGFGTKAGIFPMHTWLPDAHSEAPSPVSAMLSGVLLSCALLVIFRFAIITNLVVGSSFTQTLFLVFGTLSVAASAFFMVAQRDIKRLLAYSSIENIGLILIAFGLGGPLGILAGLLQTINHSLVKSLMFCTFGNIQMKYRSRNVDQIKGIFQVLPVSGFLMMVGTLALVGTPPFNIFVSKFLIITAGLAAGYTWLMVVCLLLFTVVFVAFFRVMASTLFGEKPENVTRGENNWLTLLPGAVLVLLIVGLGLFIPSQLMALLKEASSLVLTGNPGPQIAITSLKDFLTPLARLLP